MCGNKINNNKKKWNAEIAFKDLTIAVDVMNQSSFMQVKNIVILAYD